MKIREWAASKLSNVVQEAVIEPVKQDVQEAKENASEKIGLVTNVLRFLVCTVIGIAMLRDAGEAEAEKTAKSKKEPTQIIINNYIHEGGPVRDTRKYQKPQGSRGNRRNR